MKRFLRDFILFIIPVLVVIVMFMVFVITGYVSGEFWDTERIAEIQHGNSQMAVGLGYNEQEQYYKYVNARLKRANILVLGTSRSMQFSSRYFADSFYNAGGAVHGNYREYINFLKNLDYTPKLLILDLDSWVFNDEWNKNEEDFLEFVPIEPIDRNNIVMARTMLEDFVNRKWNFAELNKYPNNMGFNGRINDNGFWEDGSYHYGLEGRNITASADYGFVDTFNRINNGTARFEYGEHIDADTVKQLEELLRYCVDNDIYVVAYQAPFAPSVYDKMTSSGDYSYLDEITPCCEELFGKYNYEYYDFASVSDVLDITDDYFVDGFHGSEVCYAMMVEEIIDRGSRLRTYVDNNKLIQIIQDRYNNILLENPD